MDLKRIRLEDLDGGDNLLQSGFWGAHKSAFGWSPLAFKVSGALSGDRSFPLLVLQRSLAGPFSLGYVPHGPDLGPAGAGMAGNTSPRASVSAPEAVPGAWGEISRALCSFLAKGVITLRIDPNRGAAEQEMKDAGFIRAPMDVQPPNTVILDLRKDEDALLAEMKPKTRYNVRLASKRGVEVRESGRDGLEDWYGLYRQTAIRDGIAIHSFEYYDSLFTLAGSFPGPRPSIRLMTAWYGGTLLAGIITAFCGRRATYLYGASSNEHRNLMPAYGLQWETIVSAKNAGCTEYDLFGIPATDDPSEPMAGLYRFKTGFGGRIFRYAGSWDSVRNPVVYRLYGAAERLRSDYYRKFKKRKRGGV